MKPEGDFYIRNGVPLTGSPGGLDEPWGSAPSQTHRVTEADESGRAVVTNRPVASGILKATTACHPDDANPDDESRLVSGSQPKALLLLIKGMFSEGPVGKGDMRPLPPWFKNAKNPRHHCRLNKGGQQSDCISWLAN